MDIHEWSPIVGLSKCRCVFEPRDGPRLCERPGRMGVENDSKRYALVDDHLRRWPVDHVGVNSLANQ
jgi:hypothetical protein